MSLILNSARLATRKSKRAPSAGAGRINSRRKTVSRSATRCAPASIARGKRIQSACALRGRKLISGLRAHVQTSHPQATATSRPISDHFCQVLRAGWRRGSDAAGDRLDFFALPFARPFFAGFTRRRSQQEARFLSPSKAPGLFPDRHTRRAEGWPPPPRCFVTPRVYRRRSCDEPELQGYAQPPED